MSHQIKTICTLGPASLKHEVFSQLVQSGMDVVRLNFSHATLEQLVRVKQAISLAKEQYGRNVKLLMDLQGPRMRVGMLPDEGIQLNEGDRIIFSTNKENTAAIFINDPYLHEDIQIDQPMFLANGEMELLVIDKKNTEITAKVIRGGILYSRKGVNVPETNLTTRGLTEKDKQDIAFGVSHGVDYIAMSFVKDAQDIEELRSLIAPAAIQVCAKIEIKQAISHVDEIIQASDSIMVARGDLGVELPLEEIPHVQKDIIARCIRLGKPSIVATQMLTSMIDHPHPTRAEISDIANAVLDGASGLMLSDETAFGKFPVKALQTLVKTAYRAEDEGKEKKTRIPFYV